MSSKKRINVSDEVYNKIIQLSTNKDNKKSINAENGVTVLIELNNTLIKNNEELKIELIEAKQQLLELSKKTNKQISILETFEIIDSKEACIEEAIDYFYQSKKDILKEHIEG